MKDTLKLTYRIVRFGATFVGMAWAYQLGVIVTTAPRPSYTDARALLASAVDTRSQEQGLPMALHYFDGEYEHDPRSGQILAWEGSND